ncbi:uncharacterized protein LOC141623312 isoform X2 [Silene latifolia]|uniref:uncharacterized protein LOC141623312 isoform X2 n=1 Tax=Silene latifolia TaxID=37657 RepID=UPI003D770E86
MMVDAGLGDWFGGFLNSSGYQANVAVQSQLSAHNLTSCVHPWPPTTATRQPVHELASLLPAVVHLAGRKTCTLTALKPQGQQSEKCREFSKKYLQCRVENLQELNGKKKTSQSLDLISMA